MFKSFAQRFNPAVMADGATFRVSIPRWPDDGIIARVQVYLMGINPQTGEEIKDCIGSFSNASALEISHKKELHGEFFVHYLVESYDGDKQMDVIPPKRVFLNCPAKKPYIKYRCEKPKKGWTRLTVETNCVRRCSDRLWAIFDDSYQKLPPFREGKYSFMLPTEGAVNLIVKQPETAKLPEPGIGDIR